MISKQQIKQNYRPEEAATYLAVSKGTLWGYVRQGLLEPISLSPRVTVFRLQDLERFVEERARASVSGRSNI